MKRWRPVVGRATLLSNTSARRERVVRETWFSQRAIVGCEAKWGVGVRQAIEQQCEDYRQRRVWSRWHPHSLCTVKHTLFAQVFWGKVDAPRIAPVRQHGRQRTGEPSLGIDVFA